MESLSWKVRGAIIRRWSLLSAVFIWALASRAQTTNVLNLCSEDALRTAVGLGGIYRVDCGSNISTLSLTQPLVVGRDLTLFSTQQVLLDGQSLTRLIVVKPGVKLTLRNFLLFSGTQTETNVNDGGIPDTAGGGIFNDGGIVTVLDGRFQANSVVGVTGQTGTGDDEGEAGGDGAGGAIYNNGGQVILSNVVFEANTAKGGTAGAGGNGGFGNGGNGGSGGTGAGAAIYSNGGSVTLYACTFTNNTATGTQGGAAGTGGGILGFPGDPGQAGDAVGAAIADASADLTIYACTFVSNRVTAANGLEGNAGVFGHAGEQGKDGGNAAGGAVYSTGRLWMTNCTLAANTAVAGNGGTGGAASSDSLFGTNGGRGGNGGAATGGALENTGSALVVNCTFSDNPVTGGTAGAGGAASGIGDAGDPGEAGLETGGAIYGRGGDVAIANNLFANSAVTLAGNISDHGGNLATDLNPLLTAGSSLNFTFPALQPLADNGGLTATMALLTNSPAINHGLGDFCPPLDQRGSNRVDTCDIGAFEFNGTPTSVSFPPIPTNVLSSFTFSHATNEVVLQWPAGYTNLYLEMTTNLMISNTVWTIVSSPPTNNGGTNLLTIATTNAAQPLAFFRLIGLTNLFSTNVTSTNDSDLPPFPR